MSALKIVADAERVSLRERKPALELLDVGAAIDIDVRFHFFAVSVGWFTYFQVTGEDLRGEPILVLVTDQPLHFVVCGRGLVGANEESAHGRSSVVVDAQQILEGVVVGVDSSLGIEFEGLFCTQATAKAIKGLLIFEIGFVLTEFGFAPLIAHIFRAVFVAAAECVAGASHLVTSARLELGVWVVLKR